MHTHSRPPFLAIPFALSRSALLLLPLLVTACAVDRPLTSAAEPTGAGAKSGQQITEIASTPLSDLNLVRTRIPPALLAAQKNPYGAPAGAGCTGLAEELKALDGALGADLDAPLDPDDPGLAQRGAAFVGDAAWGAVRGAAEGVMPFRAWVRKLTGAEKHARTVAAAISAGVVRRAYLKGLGQAAGCEPPAAPRRREAEAAKP
ncbi:MAG: hypothetical protein AB1899_02000 [Pseudomonadota bacterium]